MYSESDKHCAECVCAFCDLRGTSRCIEGEDTCDRCDNTEHATWCPWGPGEEA